jgi:hypothetical protein
MTRHINVVTVLQVRQPQISVGKKYTPGPIWATGERIKKTPWSESANELYRPSDRRLSAKWLPTFADRRCHVVSVTDPYGRILGFLDRSRYFSIK